MHGAVGVLRAVAAVAAWPRRHRTREATDNWLAKRANRMLQKGHARHGTVPAAAHSSTLRKHRIGTVLAAQAGRLDARPKEILHDRDLVPRCASRPSSRPGPHRRANPVSARASSLDVVVRAAHTRARTAVVRPTGPRGVRPPRVGLSADLRRRLCGRRRGDAAHCGACRGGRINDSDRNGPGRRMPPRVGHREPDVVTSHV